MRKIFNPYFTYSNLSARYKKAAIVFLVVLCGLMIIQQSSAQTMGITTVGNTNYPQTIVGDQTTTPNGSNSGNNLTFNPVTIASSLTAISIRTFGTTSGQISVTIYNNNAGVPGTKLFNEVTATVTANTLSTIAIPNTYLAAGTYWLAYDMNSSSASANFVTKNTSVPGYVRRNVALTYGMAFPANPATTPLTAGIQDHISFVGVAIEGYAKATKATLPANGTFSSVSFYSHAVGSARLAIFSDNAGAPNVKQWESGDQAVTASAWTTVNISAGTPTSLSLTAGTYWLVWQWNSAANGPSYTGGAASSGNYKIQSYGAFPTPWTGGTTSTENWSIYATYTTPPTITSLVGSPQCRGGTITINGTNLTGATAANVKIGGTPVSSITSNSATQIVAVIGSGTTGTVSVTTAGGSVTSAATFTVNPLPTAFTVSGTGAYCSSSSGGDVTLSGSISGVNYQLFRGATGLATLAGSGAALDFGFQTTAGTYTVVATDATTNCTATMTGSAVITITPQPNTTFTYPTYTYCAAGSSSAATLSGSPTTGAFSSSPSGINFVSPSNGQINLATSTPGTYSIIYTVIAAGGCATYTYTNPTSVVINAQPASFSVSGTGSYCSTSSGGDVTLSGSISGVNYQLFRGATGLATLAGSGAALDFGFQATAGTYTVVATDATTNCTATMTGSAVITITPQPNTTFTYPTYTYCATGSSSAATLSGSPTTGTFSSSPAGVNFVSTSNGQINLATSTPGTYSIIYTVAASGGCGVYTYTNPTSVVINAQPASFTVSGTGTYCSTTGGDVTLSGSISGVNYHLFRGATGLATLAGSGAALDFGFQTTAGTYTVVATDATTNCTATMTGSAVITITPAPNTTFTYATYSYCKTGTSPAASISGSPTTGTFSASPAGLVWSNSSTGIINLALSTAGTYAITYTVGASGGCSIYTYTQPTNVVVNALPAVDAGADIVSNCSGSGPITMTGATGTGSIGTVTWSGGAGLGTFSGSGTNPSTYIFTPSVPQGSFTATLTATVASPCSGSNVTDTRIISWGSAGSWIGVTSTDWNTASNWCGGIPTSSTDVTIPAVGTTTFQPIIGNVGGICRNITLNGTLGFSGAYNLDVYGDWTNNGSFTAAANSSVTFRSSSNNILAGSNATTFYNLIVNKGATANTLISTARAFMVNSNLTVTQGNLILQATDANYTVTGDILVPAAGMLTHSVNWDTYGKLLSVGGNIAIDGVFTYTTRSHVQMTGSAKTVRTGTVPGSAFSILTLTSTGTITASGTITINDNFWAMFGTTGSFSTSTFTVNANAALLSNNGTVNINGGTLNVSGGMYIGSGTAAITNLSSGTLNADFVNVGDASVNGTLNHSGGTANIGNLTISTTGTYTCTNSPIINVTGSWTNNKTFTAATSQVNFNGSASANH